MKDMVITLALALPLIGLGPAGTATSSLAAEETFVDGLAAFDAGDIERTARIWAALADEGDSDAAVGLGGLHLAGNGVRRDPEEAARLFRLAAEQGDHNGQLNLGRLHLDGIGVERDLGLAYGWFTLAARQGRRWAKDQRQAIASKLSDDERLSAEALIARFGSN